MYIAGIHGERLDKSVLGALSSNPTSAGNLTRRVCGKTSNSDSEKL